MIKTANAMTPGDRCPAVTQGPARILTAITALIVVAIIIAAIGMAAHGFHTMNLAGPGMAWTHM